MTLRCHACDKPLIRYAVSNVGADGVEYGFGPKCGAALLVRKRKRAAPAHVYRPPVPARDQHTRDWINEVAA
jgi:hypothetical protein